jgi:hypothetical protein
MYITHAMTQPFTHVMTIVPAIIYILSHVPFMAPSRHAVAALKVYVCVRVAPNCCACMLHQLCPRYTCHMLHKFACVPTAGRKVGLCELLFDELHVHACIQSHCMVKGLTHHFSHALQLHLQYLGCVPWVPSLRCMMHQPCPLFCLCCRTWQQQSSNQNHKSNQS